MRDRLHKLSAAGVSVWLDDLSRERIETGNLAELVKKRSVVGVTTNPAIFANALAGGDRYDDQIRCLVGEGADAGRVIFELTTQDVRNACDILAPAAASPHGAGDGRVSIEVDPTLAHRTLETVENARALWAAVDRPNVLIKIPATPEGLSAITAATAEGISVNVTLIFSAHRYRQVMDAYLAGLEYAYEDGLDISAIGSVASFFVSRVDTEVDARLERIGTPEALALRGQAALANARLAYAEFEKFVSKHQWIGLERLGATRQRPLWASTGVKNPAYPDTLYVTDLVVPGTVNTMPEETLLAFADHGEVHGDQVTGTKAEARAVFDRLTRAGVDLDDVFAVLETEGVAKFEKSWLEMVRTVETKMAQVQ